MLPPDLPLILSPQAEDDLADILQYTLETWGEAQVYVYREVLDNALLTIQQHPHIGSNRPEISPVHKILPAGEHLIIYRLSEIAVNVSRILYRGMDIKQHL